VAFVALPLVVAQVPVDVHRAQMPHRSAGRQPLAPAAMARPHAAVIPLALRARPRRAGKRLRARLWCRAAPRLLATRTQDRAGLGGLRSRVPARTGGLPRYA
jgi:hypothetical protein